MFHQRHVLVGCSVNHNLGMIRFKYSLQSRLIRDGQNLNLDRHFSTVGDAKFLLHIIGAVLIDIQQDQLLGLHLSQLTAQLRADRATAASDQNDLTPIILRGSCIVDYNGLAEQQLLDVEVAQMASASGGLHSGEVVDLDLIARGLVIFVETLFPLVVGTRQREYHFLYSKILHLMEGCFTFQQHRNTLDRSTGFCFADVHKATGHIYRGGIAQELLGQTDADTTRTDDGDFDLITIQSALADN